MRVELKLRRRSPGVNPDRVQDRLPGSRRDIRSWRAADLVVRSSDLARTRSCKLTRGRAFARTAAHSRRDRGDDFVQRTKRVRPEAPARQLEGSPDVSEDGLEQNRVDAKLTFQM